MNKNLLLLFCTLLFNTYALSAGMQAVLEIEAGTAMIDEPKGISIYAGNAKITHGKLTLFAEKIQVFNTQQTVTKIIANGTENKPAKYKQNQPNQPRFVEATATKIIYFVDKQFVRLKGNAHLIQGFDSFSGGILNYDIKNDKIIAKKSKDGTQRVKFKIKL